MSVHPSKNCMAMQVGECQLNLLFLKEKQAEEVKLTFPKSKKILGFSFVFGDDFNITFDYIGTVAPEGREITWS